MPDVNSGPGTGPCPNCSKTTAQSIVDTPAPPYSSGNIMPNQPISAAFFNNLRSKHLLVFVPLGHLVRRHFGLDEIRRNLFQHLLGSSVKPKSISFSYVRNQWNLMEPLERKRSCFNRSNGARCSNCYLLASCPINAFPARFLRGRTAEAETTGEDQTVGVECAAAMQLAGTSAHGVLEVDDFVHR